MCLTIDTQHTLCYHTTHTTTPCFQARHPLLTSSLRILTFASQGGSCPRTRKTRYHWDCCSSCTTKFHDAGIPTHTFCMMVHNWRVDNDYHGPLVIVRGAVGVTLFREDDVYGQERAREAAGIEVVRDEQPRQEQAERQPHPGKPSQPTTQEGDVFVDIELDEHWAAQQRTERKYADMVRAWGRDDEEEEREEMARKARQRIAERAARREERRWLEAGEIPERRRGRREERGREQRTPQRMEGDEDWEGDGSPRVRRGGAVRTRTV